MLVSAILSPNGAPAEVFGAGEAGSFEPVASEKLLAELEAVLLRPKFRRYLSEDEVRGYVGRVRSSSTMVPDPAFDPGLTPIPRTTTSSPWLEPPTRASSSPATPISPVWKRPIPRC